MDDLIEHMAIMEYINTSYIGLQNFYMADPTTFPKTKPTLQLKRTPAAS